MTDEKIDSGKNDFDKGVELFLLETEKLGEDDKKIRELYLKSFRASADKGYLSGKVLAACLTTNDSNPYMGFTVKEFIEIKNRVDSGSGSAEDYRNMALCYEYDLPIVKLMDSYRQDPEKHIMDYLQNALSNGDLIALHKRAQRNIGLLPAMDAGSLPAIIKCLEDENFKSMLTEKGLEYYTTIRISLENKRNTYLSENISSNTGLPASIGNFLATTHDKPDIAPSDQKLLTKTFGNNTFSY